MKGTTYCWLKERTDGRHGAGILLDVLVGTERIFAGIGLLEVPAVVDLFTKTGQARLYSDLMRPEADVPASPEAAALGIKYQGWVPDEAPYMLVGRIYSVHPSEQGIRTWLRTWTPPVPAKQSGDLRGPHPWKLAFEVERRALTLRPCEPLSGAGRRGRLVTPVRRITPYPRSGPRPRRHLLSGRILIRDS